MPSYLITGASRGIGYEFLRQYSNDAQNTVIALVRNFDLFLPIGELGKYPEELTKTFREAFEINVTGNVHLFNLFLPLIIAGKTKKIITISPGLADNAFTNQWGATPGALYAASKAAMNTVIAKFNAQYKKDGVLFLALCPGPVEVGHYDGATAEDLAAVEPLLNIFKEYAPGYEKPKAPKVSVRMMRDVIDAVSLEKGDGGAFLSQYLWKPAMGVDESLSNLEV